MKKLAVGLAACGSAILLASCTPQDIQNGTKVACGYEPAVGAVVAIANIFAPGVGSLAYVTVGQQIITTICNAATQAKAQKGFISSANIRASVIGPDGKAHSVRLGGKFVQ